MPDNFDVFLSYAHADGEWVRRLAENLHQSGLNVFFDEWQVGPKDVLAHRLDAGLANSRTGVLVVTPTALSQPWVLQEYAAMVTRTVEGKQQLIPVLLADAEMPPLLASRVWIDFRNADGPVYEAKVRELITALKGERPGPSPRIEPPPDTRFRAQGPLRRRLRIGLDEVLFLDGAQPVQHRPAGFSHVTEQRLWELERARRRGIPEGSDLQRSGEAGGTERESLLHTRLLDAGAALTRAFLEGEAGVAARDGSRGKPFGVFPGVGLRVHRRPAGRSTLGDATAAGA